MFGEEILERLPEHSNLCKTDNPARKLLINSVGAWLDDFYDGLFDFFTCNCLIESKGGYLDVLGSDFSIARKVGESDEDYRKRIVYKRLGHLTAYYLKNIYDIDLYVKISDFNHLNNTLTSDNPYIGGNGFMSVADTETKKSINNKFILGDEITWLTL